MLRLALAAMATRFELVLCGEDDVHLRAAGEAACEAIRDCERRYSRFDRASLVTHLAREAPLRWVRVDAELFELLALSAAVHAASGGAFDPTVGGAMDAARAGGAAAVPGMDAVELDGERCAVRFARPGLALDLGGVGKGAALDAAAALLEDAGVRVAFLHAGTSTALALDAPAGAPAWRVGLPSGGSVDLVRRALSVSRADGRDGAGLTLDPATGRPVRTARCVCVTAPGAAPGAALADAWSTALAAGARPECLPPGLDALPLAS